MSGDIGNWKNDFDNPECSVFGQKARGIATGEVAISILGQQLRKFGRRGPKGHETLDGVEKCGWGGEEFETDEIAVERAERRRTDVLDPGFGHDRLAIDLQLDGLNRLDR